MAKKSFLSDGNLETTWSKIKTLLAGKVSTDPEGKKGLSTNDYTTAEKQKLAGIATGAQVNAISHIQVNGVEVSISNGTVNIDLSTYAKKTDVTSAMKFMGSCTWAVLIAKTDQVNGAVWNITDKDPEGKTGQNYVCIKSNTAGADAWDSFGGAVDLSGYATKDELTAGLAAKASASHTHAQSDITNLTTDLAKKANDADIVALTDSELDAILNGDE